MSLQHLQLIPELQYYFEKFITTSQLNFSQVPAPAKVFPPIIFTECFSFIRLLFDDYEPWPFDSTNVFTYYRDAPIMECPDMARSRLMLYPAQSRYYICDDTTACVYNLFGLQEDDYTMLELLYQYRIDSTAEIPLPILDDMTTSLSKLIWIYLSLKVYGDYSRYDNDIIYANEHSPLENAYEIYVIENIFNYIAGRGT